MSDSQSEATSHPAWTFVLLGLAQAAVYLAMAVQFGSPGQTTAALVAALAAFTLYALAYVNARRLTGRTHLLFVFSLGLLFRAFFFFKEPLLSDDFFRYLWDGLVQQSGINPYLYAPAHPALAGIADALRSQVNHPEVPTIYPPLAQLAFAAAGLVGGGWLTLKALWLACDLAIAFLLFGLVPERQRLQALTMYWWSPLVVIEVAWNAHLDLLGVLPLVIALRLARRASPNSLGLGLALAGAALVKYFAVLMVPAAARSARPTRVAVAFGALVLALYAAYASAGEGLFAGLFAYARSWRFNDGLFWLLSWLSGSTAVAKAIASVVIAFVVVSSVRNRWSLDRSAFWITGAILLVSPTVHPWYLLWMVPLIAIRPNRAWLYLTGSVFLAYFGLSTYQTQGIWPEPWWIRLAVYGPFFFLLITDAWRGSWWSAAWEEIRTSR